MNGPLAKFYGVAGVTGDAFQRVDLDADSARRPAHAGQRADRDHARGATTTPSFAASSLPKASVRHGYRPRRPGLMVTEPPVDPTRTTRERFVAHRTVGYVRRLPRGARCASASASSTTTASGCWQDTDNGKADRLQRRDSRSPTQPATSMGAIELANKLASSQDCPELLRR